MESDTGTAVSFSVWETYVYSICHSNSYRKCLNWKHTQESILRHWDNCYGNHQTTLPLVVYYGLLVVVKRKSPSLFGRNRLDKIRLDWPAIHNVQKVTGNHSRTTAATPRFCKARIVLYAYKAMVESCISTSSNLQSTCTCTYPSTRKTTPTRTIHWAARNI